MCVHDFNGITWIFANDKKILYSFKFYSHGAKTRNHVISGKCVKMIT